MQGRPRVVVVGAGFGGLFALRALARSKVEVLLVDRGNYHLFLPLLYQVAAAELEPEDIAYPVRAILQRQQNARFRMTDVSGLDLDEKKLKTNSGEIDYDYLIVSAGSVTNYYEVPGAEEHSFPLKTLDDAVRLRNHILTCFERAAREPDAETRRRMLTFAIAGGGSTGVEFAGALAELIYRPLARDYPGLDIRQAKVILIEAKDRLLPEQITCCHDDVLSRLTSIAVQVRLNAAVTEVTPDAVHLKDGKVIPADTVVWTAGVTADPLSRVFGVPVTKEGRILVTPTLQLPDHPEIYVIGDLAYLEQDEEPLPQVAPVAVQEGQAAAKNILRQVAGQEPLPFRYRDRGTMAVIGRGSAVAELPNERVFTGFTAWLLWIGVHLFNLIGFRNRVMVMINWALDYLFYERNVRLILS